MAIGSFKTTRDIARIWFYWKIPALVVFVLIVFVISFYSFTATPKYVSTAKLMMVPRSNSEAVITPTDDPREYLTRPVSAADLNTEIQLLESNTLIKNTLEQLDKKRMLDSIDRIDEKEKSKWLLGSLSINPILSSNIIEVSLESPNKDSVADALSTFLDTYFSYRKKIHAVSTTEVFYDDQKEYYAKKLDGASEALRQFKQRWNILNMEAETNANLELIASFQKDLQNLEIQIVENQSRLAMLEDGLNIKGDEVVLSKAMQNMPVIVELAKGLVPLLIKRTEISKTFTKESREYQMINDQIKMLRKEIQYEIMNASKTDTLETKTLIAKRNQIEKKIEEIKQDIKDFQFKKDSFDSLVAEVEIAKKNLLKYGDKKEDSRVYTERDKYNLSNVLIVEAPSRPKKPKSPNKLLAFQVSIVLGLFAAIILPFILETLNSDLKTEDDVERILAVPVISSFNEL